MTTLPIYLQRFAHTAFRSTLLLAVLLALGGRAAGAAGAPCTSEFLVDWTFANGARWQFCWEERAKEGIVLHDIRYQAPGEELLLMVLFQANLAQVHVPYDDNAARFHDLSDYGLGSYFLLDLDPEDCPDGTLLTNNGKDVLCQTVAPRGYAYKYGSTQRQGEALTLFSVSQIGEYNYVPSWRFDDDGAITPAIAATGRLQLHSSDPSFGWPLGTGDSDFGTNHAHNIYWRLDFDLDDAADDLVEQIDFTTPGASTRPMVLTPVGTEAALRVHPARLRFWRVLDTTSFNKDNHEISYELQPQSSHTFRGPSYEPFTLNDVYVTQYNACELYASHNPTGGGCGENVSEFVNGEAVTDLVLWYGVTFHHVPRDEDEPNMPVHWLEFNLTPRDWTAESP